jgi:glycosyltransferase involved in cell wall biosynthesis
MSSILMYDPYHWALFGAQRSMLALADGLRNKGFHPIVATGKEGALSSAARKMGLTVEILPVPNHLDIFEGRALRTSFGDILLILVHLLIYAVRIHGFVRRRKIKILYANDLRSVLFLSFSRLLSRKRLIWYIRGGPSFGVLSAAAALLASQIVLISRAAVKALPLWVQRWTRQKTFVNYIGIDVPAYGRVDDIERRAGLRRRYGLPENGILIASIGSVSPRKGFDTFLASLEMLPSEDPAWHAVIAGVSEGAGSAGYLRTLVKHVEEANLPVTFLGWTDNVRELLSVTDVFVLASREEGLGRVILEAMASHLPIVVTYAGGSEETVADEVSGFVVQPDDPTALASALQSLTSDMELRARMGTQARIRCEQVFSVDSYVNGFVQLLRG